MISRREFLRSSCAFAGAGLAIPAFFRTLDVFAPPVLFNAPPAVGRVTGRRAEINAVLPGAGELVVDWGMTPDFLNNRAVARGQGSLTVTLDGLSPGERHFYRASVSSLPSRKTSTYPPASFTAQKQPDQGFRFLVCADSHLLGGSDTFEKYGIVNQTAALAAREGADFVIFAGDEVCLDGSGALRDTAGITRDQHAVNERYAAWRSVWSPLLATCPAYFALGNHEAEGGCFAGIQRHGRHYTWQRWGAVARKQYILNPRPDTYPEGGENEGWRDPADTTGVHASPLENYFAWSWGDALFIVLDPFRYCGPIEPGRPEDWTLGPEQLAWFERTLRQTTRKHIFVCAHHLVGGSPWNSEMNTPGGYGRGGAECAHLGEQAVIHRLMKENGVRFFLYGHDHILRARERDGVNYVCAGRSMRVSRAWWSNPGWKEVYGNDFVSLAGYLIVDVAGDEVRMNYRISADSPWNSTRFEGVEYPLARNGRLTVDDDIHDVIRIWEPEDRRTRDLFVGGRIEGRDIVLGRLPRRNNSRVRAAFVGQKFRVGV